MSRIAWDAPDTRFFDVGLDRGVLYPKFKSAVPWNGLVSVDEDGGEGVSAYFMDGRPYLYFPEPKEYSANLKAITYPDEFAALMGFPEVATGLYFDSQVGEQFGLSYRTLVGSATEGTTAGYKIHLVYNAVVVPDNISYETISGDVSPINFGWKIQAVPVNVPGYRPTAHIIIDTRHMLQANIDMIEALIYGTPPDILMDGGDPGPGPDLDADGSGGEGDEVADGGDPSDYGDITMPDPNTILDLLSYGDNIIITDLGGGFWKAEGAYRNVHLIEPGIFELENVDATIDGVAGTFTVSTTIN